MYNFPCEQKETGRLIGVSLGDPIPLLSAIRTMAYELARNNPQLEQGIIKAKNLARLMEGYLGPQFDELIKTSARRMSPATLLVIVIDAPEEALHCDKGLEDHFLLPPT